MLYIERSGTEKTYKTLENEDYSFHELLVCGVEFYQSIQDFLKNAFMNMASQESFPKLHTQHAYDAIHEFILRKNEINQIDVEIENVLKLYVYGLVEMFYSFSMGEIRMAKDTFVKFCEENMPDKLKPYLLEQC